MRYALANRRNAARRRSWLLPCSAENYVAAVVRGRRRGPVLASLVRWIRLRFEGSYARSSRGGIAISHLGVIAISHLGVILGRIWRRA